MLDTVNDEQGLPRFTLDRGSASKKVMVVSVPKSGTYMLGRYLENLGLVSTGVHLGEAGLTDYRGRSIEEMVSLADSLYRPVPLEQSIPMIAEGQFAVGHLAYSPSTEEMLKDFTIVFSYRQIRPSLVSAMRFFENEGRGDEFGTEWKSVSDPKARMLAFAKLYFPSYLAYMGSVALWVDSPRVVKACFEMLMGDHGPIATLVDNNIAEAVGTNVSWRQRVQAMFHAKRTPTKTWSGKRSNTAEYWSDEVEELYREHGGADINEKLGYPSDQPNSAVA